MVIMELLHDGTKDKPPTPTLKVTFKVMVTVINVLMLENDHVDTFKDNVLTKFRVSCPPNSADPSPVYHFTTVAT